MKTKQKAAVQWAILKDGPGHSVTLFLGVLHMKLGFASDHAGYDLKERLKAWALAQGHEAVDFGTDGHASVDYPDFAHRAAAGMDRWERLVLVCGSGIGISIAANRHANVRCALVTSPEHARLARQHNDANAIAFGQRLTDPLQAEYYLKTFLETPFLGGRHKNRVAKIELEPGTDEKS